MQLLSNFNGKKDTLCEGITCEWDVGDTRKMCMLLECFGNHRNVRNRV